jgi:small GTP-binding protein
MIENKKDINNEAFDYQFKIVLLGDSEVGKSKIVSNYLNGGIPLKVEPTNGWKSDAKVIKKKGKKILFEIMDISDKNESNISNYCDNCEGGFVVYDITKRKSYANVDYFINQLKKNVNDVPIILLGNKVDSDKEREVTEEEGKKKAQQFNVSFYETGANSGKNIDQVFDKLFNKILEKHKKNGCCSCW